MDVPNYIAALLQPSPVKPRGRRVWSIDLETVWVPFFTATNTAQATAIPHEALGAPLRLNYDKDGEVRFSKTGRPMLKVATEVASQIRIVRENFVANLQAFTGRVVARAKDAYKAEVEASQKAAEPILAKMDEELALAVLRLQEKAEAAQAAVAGDGAAPQPEPVAAAA